MLGTERIFTAIDKIMVCALSLSNNPFAMKYLVANRYLQLNLKHSWKLMMMAMSVITTIFQSDIFPRDLYFHSSQIDDVRM